MRVAVLHRFYCILIPQTKHRFWLFKRNVSHMFKLIHKKIINNLKLKTFAYLDKGSWDYEPWKGYEINLTKQENKWHFNICFYYIPINDTTFALSFFWPSDTESRINELRFSDKVGRSKPPPVLTSGFNRLIPPRSICRKVVNTGQYGSEWSIENSKGRFCGGLRYLYRFYVLSIEKRKKILLWPCQGHFSWWVFHLKTLVLSSALQWVHAPKTGFFLHHQR